MLKKLQFNGRALVRVLMPALGVIALISAPGCNLLRGNKVKTAALPARVKTNTVAPIDLTKSQPNEAGKIPIIMYHDLVDKQAAHGLQYPCSQFRKDIEWLYAHKYRPIGLSDFVNGRIDCPEGMSPVILTFDDAVKGQFRILPDGKTDPNCVVGILEDFHAKHPDWQLRGTFFVLTDADPRFPPPFYQKEFAQGKLEQLVKDGFEVGNHTVHHKSMNRLSDAQATAEIAGAVAGIHKYLPDYDVNELALPYGRYPKNLSVVKSGTSNGISYKNIVALKAAWRPVSSPMARGFNPYMLERITPGDKFQQSYWWLNYLEKNKSEKFIRDGDPNTYTVNSMSVGLLDKQKILKNHYHIRTYRDGKVISTT